MRVAAILMVAYVLTGIHYVWRDLREPLYNQPGYAREYTVRGRLGPLAWVAIYWLPGTIFSFMRRGPFKPHVISWVLFAALAVAGLYLSRI